MDEKTSHSQAGWQQSAYRNALFLIKVSYVVRFLILLHVYSPVCVHKRTIITVLYVDLTDLHVELTLLHIDLMVLHVELTLLHIDLTLLY